MAEITRDELLKLISVKQANDGGWRVDAVRGDVSSNVMGNVEGYVRGSVGGDVGGTVWGNVVGSVLGYVVGNVEGNVLGAVGGDVGGNVGGHVLGDVWGDVKGCVMGNVGSVGNTVVGDVTGDVGGSVMGTVVGGVRNEVSVQSCGRLASQQQMYWVSLVGWEVWDAWYASRADVRSAADGVVAASQKMAAANHAERSAWLAMKEAARASPLFSEDSHAHHRAERITRE